MVKLFLLLTLCGFIILTYGRTSENLKVQLPDGSRIIGRYLTSDSGKGIRAFLGVPYAEPPLGDLRFKAPQKKKPWNFELKAHNDPPICIQRDPFRRDYEISGSDDCLYINIYTPEKIEKLLPVMVFFHGGGFMCGSGIKPFYGPDYLLEHDVIYIGANYRVGPLGFLSTGDDNSPGNFGLKDQVFILKWINENIEVFGGDKNLVTIFGESAGGASVTYHMHSHLSKGLFHRGIAQSGTNLAPWGAVAHRNVAQERAKIMGEKMNCPTHDNSEMMACLRKASPQKITEAFYDYFKWDTDPMVPFPPVIEHEHEGAFLTENPRFKFDMHGNDVPLMTGVTSEEGVLKTGALIYNKDLTADLLKNWERALPISLYYDHHNQQKQDEITKKIDEFYFNNQKLTLDTQKNFTDLWTDGWFFHAMIDYLKLRFSNEKRAPTYIYLFTHKGAASFSEIFKAGSETYYGTAHAEELQYIFPIRKDLHYFFNSIPTEQDKKISKILTKLWVNFAYTGNPTPTEVEGLIWKEANAFPLDYMRIGNEMKTETKGQILMSIEKDLNPERANFWNELKAHYPADDDDIEVTTRKTMKGEL
ncbi:hypothetical protein PVAND_002771 [Polypedilum vanderplanki]|uniref:Carboxylic ester hydrolase n=1 Tax=Polypedilum vanderplanki TaxID=319348 RepID=A0A9J6BT50_POLVA|nr:hypothetical protein PVAND_002771 [Polypedilum vanderplanki]